MFKWLYYMHENKTLLPVNCKLSLVSICLEKKKEFHCFVWRCPDTSISIVLVELRVATFKINNKWIKDAGFEHEPDTLIKYACSIGYAVVTLVLLQKCTNYRPMLICKPSGYNSEQKQDFFFPSSITLMSTKSHYKNRCRQF